MKTLKYFFVGALLLSMQMPAMAQDVNTDVAAITKVVVDAKGDVATTKSQVKDFVKAHKKDAEALAGLGRAFMNAKNLEQAKVYAEMAIKANKNSASGYILHGDISVIEENAGDAAMWYETATMNDPKNPASYVKYARIYQKVDPENKEVKKYVADTYTKAKRFTDAVAAMEAYIAAKGEEVTYKEYDALADIYIDEASVEGAANDAKVKAFENADKVYAQIETKFDYAAAYAVWKRALMNYQINPDVKVGRALPFYKKYIDIVSAKAEKTASETSKLATAYTYLAVHYIQNDKKEEAKEWATKLLEIKPDDPNGLQIMSIK